MDGAGANDDEEAFLLVAALDDLDGLVAALEDGGFGLGRLLDLMLEQVGGR